MMPILGALKIASLKQAAESQQETQQIPERKQQPLIMIFTT